MSTISVCMIVKNEEKNLEACLECLKDIADEIVIADTGSTDTTKDIAKRYTDKVFDFPWTGSFSDARNFVFSKATMDYIYSADADERLDEENIARFMKLKKALLPEVEIVQMYYCNQLEHNTIYSFDKEYRPKLYKRVRNFVWRERIHEAVDLQPVVYDSDIEIIHKPHDNHGSRDLKIFADMVKKGEPISDRLLEIYEKELYIVGEKEDFEAAAPLFLRLVEEEEKQDEIKRMCSVLAKHFRLQKDDVSFFKYALRGIALEGCSELCFELGSFFEERKEMAEAAMWYYNSAHETEALLYLKCKEELAAAAFDRCK